MSSFLTLLNPFAGVAFTTNAFVSLDWATGKTQNIIADVPGIPASSTATINTVEGIYYVQLINGEKNTMLAVDTTSGKIIGNLKNNHSFADLYLQL